MDAKIVVSGDGNGGAIRRSLAPLPPPSSSPHYVKGSGLSYSFNINTNTNPHPNPQIDERKKFAAKLLAESCPVEYISDGPKSRLLKSLECGIPSEINWAFSFLYKVSSILDVIFPEKMAIPNSNRNFLANTKRLYHTYVHGLDSADYLANYASLLKQFLTDGTLLRPFLAHSNPFFELLKANRDDEDDGTRKLLVSSLVETYYYGLEDKSYSYHSLFRWACLRFFHILEIMVNFSSIDNLSSVLLRDEYFLLLLDKSLILLQDDFLKDTVFHPMWMSLRAAYLDVIANISHNLPISLVFGLDKADIFLTLLIKMFNDKSSSLPPLMIVLEIIPRLLLLESNIETVLRNLDAPFLDALVDGLMDEPASPYLDAIYQILIAFSFCPTAKSFLFAEWLGKVSKGLLFVLMKKTKQSPVHLEKKSVFAPWMSAHQRILKWLAVSYQSASKPEDTVSASDLYSQFCGWCADENIDPKPAYLDLVSLVTQLFPKSLSAGSVDGSPRRNTCLWNKTANDDYGDPVDAPCGHEAQGSLLVQHVLETHLSEGETNGNVFKEKASWCGWSSCRQHIQEDYRSHILTHILSLNGDKKNSLPINARLNLRPRSENDELLATNTDSIVDPVLKIFKVVVTVARTMSLMSVLRDSLESHIQALVSLSFTIQKAGVLGEILALVLNISTSTPSPCPPPPIETL